MGTEITALLYSTFAHCVALNCIWLPPRLTLWVELLPAEGPDSDAFDEELYHEFS